MTPRRALSSVFRLLVEIAPDSLAIQLAFRRELGRFPNLRNPASLNDKINWRKLYQHDPRFQIFCDKVAVKAEIAKLIGTEHIIPTLWSGREPEEIPFDELEPPYVIKTNHSSGHVTFVSNKHDVDRHGIIASLRKQLAYPHGQWTREWGYRNISRGILIEPKLGTSGDEIPVDYKHYVYHGRVHFIQVDQDRFAAHKRGFFDRDWQRLPLRMTYPPLGKPILRPDGLNKMIELAERIGTCFDFVRVDLYDIPSGVFFGETTFYPDGGYGNIAPSIWDYKFGEPWKLEAVNSA